MKNFDFKKYWVDVCLPVILYDARVKTAMKNGIVNYLKSGGVKSNREYDEDILPIHYSNIHWRGKIHELHWERDTFYPQMESLGIIEKDHYPPSDSDSDFDHDDYFNDQHLMCSHYEDYKEDTCALWYKWQRQLDWSSYCPNGQCHWWNPTFGLTLARIIQPKETWRVVRNWLTPEGKDSEGTSLGNHTSVINHDNTKCFDILYYGPDKPNFGGDLVYLHLFDESGNELCPNRFKHEKN